jgi:hypothetical protein
VASCVNRAKGSKPRNRPPYRSESAKIRDRREFTFAGLSLSFYDKESYRSGPNKLFTGCSVVVAFLLTVTEKIAKIPKNSRFTCKTDISAVLAL